MADVRNSKKMVLVVEDNQDDVYLFQNAAKEFASGLTFRFVGDGEEAIAYLKGEGQFSESGKHAFPDLVLLDWRLPKLDGLGVLKCIRAMSWCRGLRVFVWSDLEQPKEIEGARKAGADNFFRKGLGKHKLKELIGEIERALNGN